MSTTKVNAGPVRRFFDNIVPKAFGFKKTYNVYLYIIFAGALLGFSLAQLRYLNISGLFCKGRNGSTVPGECFYYHAGLHRVGMILHLAGVLPAGILAAFQFVPKIRHSALLAHRINGYVNILLILIGNAGALIIARRAQGGSIQTQSAVGVLVILTTVGIFMAYINVKRLQIDQHRNWMLRTLFYLGCIITTRIIMIISARILTRVDSYYELWPCDKLEYTMGNQNYTFKLYPSCATHPEIPVAVKATFNGTSAANVGSALGLSFGMALWVAIFIHLIGVEFYIQLTPGESRRLRKVSFERQLEAGFGNPGNAGLTAARFGDDSDDFEEAALKDKLTPVGSHRYSDGSLNM